MGEGYVKIAVAIITLIAAVIRGALGLADYLSKGRHSHPDHRHDDDDGEG